MVTSTHTNCERLAVVKIGFFLLSLLLGLGAVPALAKPVVIAELGTAPLIGTSTSAKEMRALVARNEGIMSAAAVKLGLTAGEYAQFRAAIDESRVAWVTVPRHLDAMSWQSAERVYIVRDVIIPAGTHGWEIDLRSHGQVLALYMPAKCGNLSLVRRAAPAIARQPVVPPSVTVPAPVAVAEVPVAPPPPAVVAPQAVAPPDDTPVVTAPIAVAQNAFPPAARRRGLPFLAPLLFGLAAIGGAVGGGPIVAPPVGCP
jgi:hypothetical protein